MYCAAARFGCGLGEWVVRASALGPSVFAAPSPLIGARLTP
jgi:hypothetical protein